MKDESSYIIRKNNIHYNEEKSELFFDYDNSDYLEKLTKSNISRTYTLYNNYYHPTESRYNNYLTNNNYNSSNKSYDDLKSTKINSSFNSNTLKEIIQNKKSTFKNLFNSMDQIINKHNKNDKNIIINNYESKKSNNIEDKKENLNKLVEHLIKVYSKDELLFIKEKISNKIEEEEEEPQPEKLLYKKHQKNELKLSSDIPTFLKTNNKTRNNIGENKDKKLSNNNKMILGIKEHKNQFFKKINKNINYKPIKINNKNIQNLRKNSNKKISKNKTIRLFNYSDLSDNNIKFKSRFYTYVKCKTSFECLENFMKRQKSYNNYITNNKINLNTYTNTSGSNNHTFIQNISSTSNPKNSIKTNEKLLDETKKMVYKNIKNKKGKNKNIKLKYNKSFSFSQNLNNKSKKSFERAKSYKSKNNKQQQNKENKDLAPIKYINHKFDYITSIYKNDKNLFKRIKEQNDKKIKKIEKLKTEYDNEKLEGCTFKPDMNKSYYKSLSYIKNYKNEINRIKNESNNEKLHTYVDFYQYKKNSENKKNKNKDMGEIGSLTPVIISTK